MNARVFSVSQINAYIKSLLDEDILLSGFFIEAEISNFKHHSSGHFYFTLKDSLSAINCVMFKTNAQALKFVPENGMKVLVYGRVSIYEKTGQYQIYAELLEPSGKGALYAAFEQLKTKLKNEGLFETAHKKEIPKFPECIAVVTSRTGAVIKDIINVCKRRNPYVKLVLFPVPVQGDGAAAEIARAIGLVNEWGQADTIIVGRGGGSIEDLWAFNEEITVRAVFNSKIPVISAVGHETDVTIVDFAADLRAPTPSAAAELAVPDVAELKAKIDLSLKRIGAAVRNKIFISKTRLKNNRLRKPLDRIYNLQVYISGLQDRLGKEIFNRIEENRALLGSKIVNLELVSPLNVLKRGYSLVYDKDERLITDSGSVSENDIVNIRLREGSLSCSVLGKGEIYAKEKNL